LKADVESRDMSKETANERYKNLYKIEFAFRTIKTTLEEIRPTYVCKKETARGLLLVAMLLYMVVKYITDELIELDFTRKFITESKYKIQLLIREINGKEISVIPTFLLEHQQAITEISGIKLK
jgi:transposase